MGTLVAIDDRQAFVARLASQHGVRLLRFLSRRLRNTADVHDLAQEVFLRLLRIERQDKIRNPEAYLLTIAGHVLHQHSLAINAVPEAIDITDILLDADLAAESDPVEHLALERRLESLDRTLKQLSPKTRTAFLLQRRDGCTLDEIAERMGISRGMVKKHLAKAIFQCNRQIHAQQRGSA